MMSIYAYLIYLSCFFQLSSLHCFLCFLFSPDQARNSYLLEPVLLLLHQARPHYLWHTYRNIYKNKMQFVSTSSHIHCLTGGKLLTVQKQSYIMTWQKSNQISPSPAGEFIFFSTLGNLGDIQLSHHYKKHNNWSKPKPLECTTT